MFCTKSGTDVCPLCACAKQENPPRSHIFPEALLRAFSKIHCNDDTNFIWDWSDGCERGASSLSYPIFCQKCETAASNEERILKNVYLKYMSSKKEQLCIPPKLSHQLRHILAILLFRGALLGIEFQQELKKTFFQVLRELHSYCLENNFKNYKKFPISEKIHLFFLPNTYFSPHNITSTSTIDYQLRNPQFTSVVVDNGFVFLYTKFDCFHCVLPIKDDSNYFAANKCSSFAGCKEDGKNFYLRHLNLQERQTPLLYFPKLLFDYNLSQIGNLTHQLLSIRSTKGCIIQSLRTKQKTELYIPKDRSVALKPDQGENIMDTVELTGELCEQDMPTDQNVKKSDKLLEEARKLSPFTNTNSESDKLRADNKILKAENQKLQQQLSRHVEYFQNKKKIDRQTKFNSGLKNKQQQIEKLKEASKKIMKKLQTHEDRNSVIKLDEENDRILKELQKRIDQNSAAIKKLDEENEKILEHKKKKTNKGVK